ncbi:MAG: 4Fe-4S binding protein [Proteobacteria bacterium]|nr:4Fe-4S binding protein [Pseudomonadota bacterium]
MKGYIEIDSELCKECMLCIEVCTKGLIKKSAKLNLKGFYHVMFEDKEKQCTGCTLCAIICPEAAIEVYRG